MKIVNPWNGAILADVPADNARSVARTQTSRPATTRACVRLADTSPRTSLKETRMPIADAFDNVMLPMPG